MFNSCYVIGSGIIGLCVAEYYSRRNKNITIISDENPVSGSYAAAANLATKGQLFGRDPHFQMKLEAKKIYPSWIRSLIDEIKCSNEDILFSKIEINHYFKEGHGVDFFENEIDKLSHLKRVLQNKEELLIRNLPLSSIESQQDKNEIIYQNEAWVDAPFLLNLLHCVLKKRNVKFIQNKLSKNLYDEISNSEGKNLIIFCTGAWTKNLLTELNLPLPQGFLKSERLTVGSTFYLNCDAQKIINDTVLFEILSQGLKQKATLSGNKNNLYFSSTSLKLTAQEWLAAVYPGVDRDRMTIELNSKNHDFLNFVQNYFPRLNLIDELKEKIGFRVGYGHKEILIEKIQIENKNHTAVVCCGAHKSGFLFGPVVGGSVENVISS